MTDSVGLRQMADGKDKGGRGWPGEGLRCVRFYLTPTADDLFNIFPPNYVPPPKR